MRLELRQRLIYGFGVGLSVLGLLLWDIRADLHVGVLIVSVLAATLGAREFRRLALAQAKHPRLAPVVVASLLLVAEAHLHDGWWCPAGWQEGRAMLAGLPIVPAILALALVWTAVSQMWRWATEDFLASLGTTLFGLVYLGVTLNLINRLALVDADPAAFAEGIASPANRGGMLLLLLVATVKFGDIAAYFGGRALGRHKMSPRISPGKTWEGFACSFIGAIGGTYLFAWGLWAWTGAAPFAGWWQPAVWGLVLGPLGVAGDLAESAMKRDAEVKDSGTMLPGFGGWLDVLDALILAAPVAWILAMLL